MCNPTIKRTNCKHHLKLPPKMAHPNVPQKWPTKLAHYIGPPNWPTILAHQIALQKKPQDVNSKWQMAPKNGPSNWPSNGC